MIQLNNPLGGILRGYTPIVELYRGIFDDKACVCDIVELQSEGMAVFAGRETGAFTKDGKTIPFSIRTSRIVQWFGPELSWKQSHHHHSIDDAQRLAEYQHAVRGSRSAE